MNFNTLKQALYEKIKMMSEEDFNNFLSELKRVYYKAHKNAKYEEFMALHFTECEQESCTLDDAREDFVFDVYNILDFLPTNNEANQIIDVFDRVTSRLGQEKRTGHWVKYSVPRCGEQHYKCTACDDYINFGVYSDYYLKAFKYCPFCGARMAESEGEK